MEDLPPNKTKSIAQKQDNSRPRPILFTASGEGIFSRAKAKDGQGERPTPTKPLRNRAWGWLKKNLVSLLTLGVLVIYTFFTGGQWKTLEKSVSDSEKQFEKTLCEMRAQTKAQQDAASASVKSAETSRLAAEGSEAAVLSFDLTFDPGDRKFLLRIDNSGHSIAHKVTARFVITRRAWPDRKMMGRPFAHVLPGEPLPPASPIRSGQRMEVIKMPWLSQKDWTNLRMGDEFLDVVWTATYDNGFGNAIERPESCQSLLYLGSLQSKTGARWEYGPTLLSCGRNFDIEMTEALRHKKLVEDQIQKEQN